MNNNIETELKFKSRVSPKNFTKKLNGYCTIIQPRTKEITTMYDNRESLMKTTDGRLRIREGYKNSLSYKKPITRDGIKIETEYESEIKNTSQVRLILNKIGYRKVSSYTRHRTIWKYLGVKIFLDEFSFGNYVEIEGIKEKIIIVAKKLGFKINENITKSYDGIYKEICELKNIKPSQNIK